MRFGSRGFREVERRFDFDNRMRDDKKEEGYRNIKPKTDITIEEARKYWDDIFSLPKEIEIDEEGNIIPIN